MPRFKNFFMSGPAPIRRTLQYLEGGQIQLRDEVRIVCMYWRDRDFAHKGAREFVFWNYPQLQYKNPHVQFLTFTNYMPTPVIQAYLENGQKVLLDVFDNTRHEIHERVRKTIGKSEEILAAEAVARQTIANPANFGKGFPRHCICEVPGQIPCSNVVPFPKEMRRKFYENPYDVDSPMKEE
ncbi:probable 28S ribosomal protein S25, mitochondrial [Paramacrobiotus metropolitanus]|uniref:probable 28S ribosomal protein S25, mitochondrial n=1 Tax=Paramacrobiotus metropolitanus TaxID=2943436 RepID=UPI0024459A74|nr:probable 28S ribosomal protein S25, mitochondrial [Paramacrobiotus metropolitanus]